MAPAEDDRLEYLTRAPVHEAFASPVSQVAQPGLEIPQPPQGFIEEAPPAIRPGEPGKEPLWIPGYWGWSAENQFIWISGTWRYPPPGMRWLPGYWLRTQNACRWVAGFWMSQDVEQVAYLPQPPAPRDEGPDQAQPNENTFWVPGCWIPQGERYGWRPGFWAEAREDWTWVPCQHVWTPQGYVFVDGYWDYPPEQRGLLFAPVAFRQGWRGGTYTPSVLLDVQALLVHLFVRPAYHHYCYGDFYGEAASGRDVVSWLAYAAGPRHFDPLAVYYRTSRHSFYEQLQVQHRTFVQRPEWRPPPTWGRYQRYITEGPRRGQLPHSPLAHVIGQAVRTGRIHGLRITERPPAAPDRTERHFRDLLKARMQLEHAARDGGRPRPGVTLRLPGVSPIERDRTPARAPDRGPGQPPRGPGDFRPGQPGKALPGVPQIGQPRPQPGKTRPNLPGSPSGRPPQGTPPGLNKGNQGKGPPATPPGLNKGNPSQGQPGKDRPSRPGLPKGAPQPPDLKNLPTPPGGPPKGGPPAKPPGLKDRKKGDRGKKG